MHLEEAVEAIQKQVYICDFGREGQLNVSMHAPHCCSHFCILGALLGLHAPLEPTQHTQATVPQKGKDRDQDIVLLWCRSCRERVGRFHWLGYPCVPNLGPQPCLVALEGGIMAPSCGPSCVWGGGI